jgi:hypothetical protein
MRRKLQPLRGGARADHERVEAVFGDLPPQILIAPEGDDGVIDRLDENCPRRDRKG